MDKEMVFISVYRCPRCDTLLEAADQPSAGWLKCPECGRPSLAPAYTQNRRVYRRPNATADGVGGHAAGLAGEELLWIPGEDQPSTLAFWLRALAGLAIVAVPVLICLALGGEASQAILLGILMALALALLLRPGGGQR